MQNDIRSPALAVGFPRYHRLPVAVSPASGWPARMVMIFRTLPMDPKIGLLTIERFNLPAVGVLEAARDLAVSGCARETYWPGVGAPSWVQRVGELGTCEFAQPSSDDLRRGLDDMPRVRFIRTRHPDTTPNRDHVFPCCSSRQPFARWERLPTRPLYSQDALPPWRN